MLKKFFQKKKTEQIATDTTGVLRFKTSLSCQGCVATVTPFLQQIEGIEHWEVDLQSPERILIVKGKVEPAVIIQKLEEAGYKAELLP